MRITHSGALSTSLLNLCSLSSSEVVRVCLLQQGKGCSKLGSCDRGVSGCRYAK